MSDRIWVRGMTVGRLSRSMGAPYFFVDDRLGGRREATELEVALWVQCFGIHVPVRSTWAPGRTMR